MNSQYIPAFQNVTRPEGLKAEILSKIMYVINNLTITEVNDILYNTVKIIQDNSYVEIPKLYFDMLSPLIHNFPFNPIFVNVSSFSM